MHDYKNMASKLFKFQNKILDHQLGVEDRCLYLSKKIWNYFTPILPETYPEYWSEPMLFDMFAIKAKCGIGMVVKLKSKIKSGHEVMKTFFVSAKILDASDEEFDEYMKKEALTTINEKLKVVGRVITPPVKPIPPAGSVIKEDGIYPRSAQPVPLTNAVV